MIDLETLEVVHLMVVAREAAQRERMNRLACEQAIKELYAKGVSSRDISNACGRDESGDLYVNPTLVLRIGREEHLKTPRRRHRKK